MTTTSRNALFVLLCLSVATALAGECSVEVLVRQADGVPPPVPVVVKAHPSTGNPVSASTTDDGKAALLEHVPCGEVTLGVYLRDVKPLHLRAESLTLTAGQPKRIEMSVELLGTFEIDAVHPQGRPGRSGSFEIHEIRDTIDRPPYRAMIFGLGDGPSRMTVPLRSWVVGRR